MSTLLEHVRISELQETLVSLHLPKDARLTLIVEDQNEPDNNLKEQEFLETLNKLKGSGNGKLMDMLLEDRRKESLL